MRARNLKPGLFKNEYLGKLPFEDRILFAGLWCLSDREGFFELRPERIAAEIFPYDKKIDGSRITTMLGHLAKIKIIACNGQYGFIPTFLNHNNPHPHEAKSTVPQEIKKTLKNICNDMPLTCHDMSQTSRADIMTDDIMNHDVMNHDLRKKLSTVSTDRHGLQPIQKTILKLGLKPKPEAKA